MAGDVFLLFMDGVRLRASSRSENQTESVYMLAANLTRWGEREPRRAHFTRVDSKMRGVTKAPI